MKTINQYQINTKYDFVIVGSGLFGSVCAFELNKKGYSVLVVEKRNHIGGNVYTHEIEGINVHQYGAHIFHTSNVEIWNYINKFASFNNFVNSPIARYKNELFNLPFNMNTFTKLWSDVFTPDDAKKRIEEERKEMQIENPTNLEEQAISLVGSSIYNKLIKGYTSKQWGRPCNELPAFIIKRIPVRFTFDNNYFSDNYQGIPIGGYTRIIEQMLENVDIILNCDFLEAKEQLCKMSKNIIYTGPIDAYFDYKFGPLEYRSVKFETKIINKENYQGVAVVNYTDEDIPYTRVIEHKHFEKAKSCNTVISFEFPSEWKKGDEPYYPINDVKNSSILEQYRLESQKYHNIYFGGRLGNYKYYDMDKTIEEALLLVKQITENE